jgi:hypothetical protein
MKMTMYSFLTQKLYERMEANGKEQQEYEERDECKDHVPAVLLFLPGTEFRRLLTEIVPYDPTVAFGLCDLGMGFPELGPVSLDELESIRGPLGMKVERDKSFKTDRGLEYFTDLASQYRRIILPDEIVPPPQNRER